jgi:hypothetical protein
VSVLRYSARGGGALFEAPALQRGAFGRARAGYNPDQPRDDDGKFGEGGGGGKSGAPRLSPKEKAARTTATKRDAEKAAKAVDKSRARADKATAKREAAEERAEKAAEDPKIAEAEEHAEAAHEEADSAAAHADKLERGEAEDEDGNKIEATPERLAEAHRDAREKAAAAKAAARSESIATREKEKAEEALERAEEAEEEANEDRDSAEAAAVESEDWHDLAKVDDLPDADRDAAINDHVATAKAGANEAHRERMMADSADAKIQNETDPQIRAADREHDRRQAEAERIFKTGEDGPDGEDWYERATRIEKESAREQRETVRKLEALRAPTIKALKQAERNAANMDRRLKFWHGVRDRDLDRDDFGSDHDFGNYYAPRDPDPEGTEDDRDGDGRTGDEEEQDEPDDDD